MQERWYGDNRDLAKWNAVAHVATSQAISRLVYVPYLLANSESSIRDAIVSEVWNHFRNLANLARLFEHLGLQYFVIETPFDPSCREAYRDEILRRIERQSSLRQLVLLDPDTGLQPDILKATHTSRDEITSIWASLHPGDCLGLYQHKWRERGWRQLAWNRFKDVIACDQVCEIFRAEIASDVTFFFAKK